MTQIPNDGRNFAEDQRNAFLSAKLQPGQFAMGSTSETAPKKGATVTLVAENKTAFHWNEFESVELVEPRKETNLLSATYRAKRPDGTVAEATVSVSMDTVVWESLPAIHEQVRYVLRQLCQAHATAQGCKLNKVTRPHLGT